MIYVIGSGPAGVSCASALLHKGLEVTMLDPGVDLEAERRQAVERMRSSLPEEWSADDLLIIRENMEAKATGLPTKHVYGSDFPYREVEQHFPLLQHHVEARPSLARGGFSNVWGGVAAPHPQEDIEDWPVTARELAPHYEAVLGFMELAAEEDELASLLPLYSRRHHSLRPSRQAEAFLNDSRQCLGALENAGIHIGRARLAVRVAPRADDPGCVYCGLCLYGCPYGLIYNAQSTLQTLQENPDFHYQTDVVVERVEERRRGVRIYAHSRTESSAICFDAVRVYLACGVYSTTRILLESLRAYEEPVTIQDSQYFLLPLLRFRGTPKVESESLHTLAQAFVEIRDPNVTRHTVHMEVFTYNDLLPKVAESRLGLAGPLFRLPIRELLRRVIVNQCFLHSEVSPTIRAHLLSPRGQDRGALVLEGRPNPETKKVVGRVWRKLLAHRKHLRAVPLPLLIQIASPGRSFHSGGSFPMRTTPSRFESDVWGRPSGFRRVHAVDATVLPTIPATTITLPVMANAHRIASGYDAT